jgi:hypothetical protein
MKNKIALLLMIAGLGIGIYGMTAYVDQQNLFEIGNLDITKKLKIQKSEESLVNEVSLGGGALLVLGLGAFLWPGKNR